MYMHDWFLALTAAAFGHVVCVPQPMQVLRGAGVALAARAMWERGECVPPAALLPDYHRLSQAERERAEREKTEGKQNEV